MNSKDKLTCDIAMNGVGWAIKKLNKPVGQLLADFLSLKCKEKWDKDIFFNAQLKYCHKVGESQKDATKNKELQGELLALAQVADITGNASTRRQFIRTYIREDGDSIFGDPNGKFYSTKWLKIHYREVD